MTAPAIVVTVATPNYEKRWRFCLDAQFLYCGRAGYEHRIVAPTAGALHPKWFKLESALGFLDEGRHVLLIDADAEITSLCPPFTAVLEQQASKDIFFVRGISGRPNSGVLLLRAGRASAAPLFLKECLARRGETVPPEDFVTAEGENGHVIMLLKTPRYAEHAGELDRSWNCSDPAYAATANIRHYTNRLRTWLAETSSKTG